MGYTADSTEKTAKKRSLSLEEAARLYREKKKAKFEEISLKFQALKRQLTKRRQDHSLLAAEYQEKITKVALLEKEVCKLKALNEQLTERLQGETTLLEAEYSLLEQEVVELKGLNEELKLKVQGQAGLEAQITRLKSLLVDVRAKIDGEIGSFPYPEPTNKSGDANSHNLIGSNQPGVFVMNPDNIQREDQLNCLNHDEEGKNEEGGIMNGEDVNGCEIENLQRMGSHNSAGFKKLPSCGIGNGLPSANVQCDDQVNSLHPGAEGKNGEGAIMNERKVENLPRMGHMNSGMKELIPHCGKGNGLPSANISNGRKNKGVLLSFLSLVRRFPSG